MTRHLQTKIAPKGLAQWLDQALAHHRAGRLAQAETLYQALLDHDPKHVQALHFSGVLAWQGGRHAQAVDLIRRSLALQPRQAQALSNLGNALRSLGRLDDALQSYRRAVELEPQAADLWLNCGVALRESGRLDDAQQAYDRALTLAPESAVVHNNIGNLLMAQKRPERALLAFENALQLDPRYVEAWSNRGQALSALHEYADSLASCNQALALRPDFVLAELQRGRALLGLSRFAEALTSLERAHAAFPDESYMLGEMLVARHGGCDWTDHAALLERVTAGIRAGRPAAMPMSLLVACDEPALQQLAARYTIKDWVASVKAPLPVAAPYVHERLRIAYLSADFHDHPVAHAAARLFELHDLSRFEVLLVSSDDAVDDDMRRRLQSGHAEFIDVVGLSDEAVAQLLRERAIDIAVDLQGFTDKARPAILALRPAPLQVGFLGYPGTLGASFIDYLIADATVVPPGSEVYYDEQVVRMPHCYLPFDDTRRVAESTSTRAQAGLPDDAFVFCCFNNSNKITPEIFDVWMRLLRAVPGSVLWLARRSADALPALQAAAEARGVAAQRLVFATRVPSAADHLARHRLADLALDTLPYNAHTTGMDALWAGLPMVSCPGQGFAARVGASLLATAGLGELITDTLADYESLALALAADPARLDRLRRRLQAQRLESPLFDSLRHTRQLETAFERMVARQRQGLSPLAFDVERPDAAGGAQAAQRSRVFLE